MPQVPGTCPFCEVEPDRKLAEGDLTISIRDAFPVSPGHTLVVPRRHVASFFDLTEAEQAAVLRAVGEARAVLDGELHPDGFNIGINVGVAAGQTVMHAHVHVSPRFVGDAEDPRGGVRHCIPGRGYYHDR